MRAVNLIPADQREGQSGLANRSHGVAYIVLGLLAGLALLVFLYGRDHSQATANEAKAARLEAKARTVQQQATSLAPYKTFIALRESRETEIATLVNSRFDWAHAVLGLGHVLPPQATIDNFVGSVGTTGSAGPSPSSKSSGTVASATPAGTAPMLTLSGCAATQSKVALTLARLRLIDGVTNVELHSSTKASGSSSSSGGSSAGSSSAACPPSYPAFNISLTFAPLPAPPTSAGTGTGSPAHAAGGPATTPVSSPGQGTAG